MEVMESDIKTAVFFIGIESVWTDEEILAEARTFSQVSASSIAVNINKFHFISQVQFHFMSQSMLT
jgi:hypothetical protein